MASKNCPNSPSNTFYSGHDWGHAPNGWMTCKNGCGQRTRAAAVNKASASSTPYRDAEGNPAYLTNVNHSGCRKVACVIGIASLGGLGATAYGLFEVARSLIA
jgi:hypothetical protein